jgi:hypothetical protein
VYGTEARSLRQCMAVRKDGEPCQGWAIWGEPNQLCVRHAGVRRRRYTSGRTPAIPCPSAAYNWPHRPGSGACRWPSPPIICVPIPAGTQNHFLEAMYSTKSSTKALYAGFGS